MGRKNVRKWRANFTKKAITRERNEISSPNSVHMCKSSIFGQIKKIGIQCLGPMCAISTYEDIGVS